MNWMKRLKTFCVDISTEDKKMKITLNPKQLKDALLRDLRATGYSVKEIQYMRVTNDGKVELDCEFYPKSEEES